VRQNNADHYVFAGCRLKAADFQFLVVVDGKLVIFIFAIELAKFFGDPVWWYIR